MDWGEAAAVNGNALELRWFDYWLKGIDNGLDKEPPVKIFVMGRNEWRYENEYPLAQDAIPTALLAQRRIGANGSQGDGRPLVAETLQRR